MKNSIGIMLNTLKDYNINLSMFIKIIDDKTAMILLARKEEINIDNDLYIVTDAVNLSNIYKEEYSDIVMPINNNYNKEDIKKCVVNRLKKIVVLKAYNILENHMDSIIDVVLVDCNKNILSNGITALKEDKCPVCGSNFHEEE